MSTETKMLADLSIVNLMLQFQEAVQNGWEMDLNSPINQWGIMWEIGVRRDDKSITAMAERQIDAPPKMTRAEILEKARAARGKGGADKLEAAAL